MIVDRDTGLIITFIGIGVMAIFLALPAFIDDWKAAHKAKKR